MVHYNISLVHLYLGMIHYNISMVHLYLGMVQHNISVAHYNIVVIHLHLGMVHYNIFPVHLYLGPKYHYIPAGHLYFTGAYCGFLMAIYYLSGLRCDVGTRPRGSPTPFTERRTTPPVSRFPLHKIPGNLKRPTARKHPDIPFPRLKQMG